jgi:hypothetical protein
VGVGSLSSHCVESQALQCLEETGSKLKMTVSQEKTSFLIHRLALCSFGNPSQD